MKLSWLSILMAVVALVSGCHSGQPAADLVLYNGQIVTVDKDFSIAEAVAVQGDSIVASGSSDEIRALAGDGAREIDLDGRTVLPGLIDSHLHAFASALYEFDHPVPDMETIGDVLDYVRARAEVLDDGDWITVSQVFITRLREQRYPTRKELDDAAPRNPVVFRTGPDASLNSLALELSGIDRNFKITDGQPGRVERDPATGEPTGILRQCSRFIKYVPSTQSPTDQDRKSRLQELIQDYNSVGITSIVDGDTSDEELELFRQLRAEEGLDCRVFMALSVNAQDDMNAITERIEKAALDPLHQYDDKLWLRGIKSYLDGGMLTGSAYMNKPWGVSTIYSIDDPEYRGMRYIEPDKLYQIMKTALANGFQFTAHSVGDGAVDAFIDAAERIDQGDFPVSDRRPCLTHANFQSPEAINRMKRLGVVANMQPAWLRMDGATLMKHFGPDRTAYFQPYKALFEAGVTVGGGSDHMQKIGSFRSINPYNPFLGIWTTITRRPRWTEEPFHPEQDITREQAIRLYTINNAFLTFEEDRKGSLEPGKLADLIILDRDILRCPVDEIPEIQVEETFLGGRSIYRRGK